MRKYRSLFITNCSDERSFSRAQELRATMQQERLAALSLMCIEHEVCSLLRLQ